uniref:Retrotransposon protein, putative, Ty3-gypsy subclass n=1 Tax=Oryza sativa subsp. japonica TaxID=39947 RepID=Q2QPR8_ORYSJ|nr:retrotransposon protein, putative, Ty3-gypsy subclass [Oryza sativa Japonica Group]
MWKYGSALQQRPELNPYSGRGATSHNWHAPKPHRKQVLGVLKEEERVNKDVTKISLLDSDPNKSGRSQVSVLFGIPNLAEIYPKLISIESAPNHSDEIQSTPTRPDQDNGSYPPILMRLPDDLAVVFTTKASPTRRPRWDPASAPIQSSSREICEHLHNLREFFASFVTLGVILQPLGTVSTEELDGYLSSPGVSSRPTEILEYDDFGYRYDYANFDDSYKNDYSVNNKIANGLQMRLRIDDSAPWNPGNEHETSLGNKKSTGQRCSLHRVDWPAGFKPTGIEKYGGTTNPESWLTIYVLAIRAAGGDNKAMANYLPVALADSARSWLHKLPCGTIGSWAELRDHFITNFQCTFECPGTQFDLYNPRNKISDITDDVIIAAFTKGIRHEDLVGKFRRKFPRTSGTTWKPKKDTPTTGGSGSTNHKDRKRKPEKLVATTTPSSRQRSRVNTFDKIMNSQCPHHPNSNHAAKDCFVYKQFAEQYTKNARKTIDGDQSTSKKKDDEDDAPTGFQDHRKELNHIFGGPLAYESKREQKLTKREINAVQPDTPQYLRWSDTTIKFDHSDHPDRQVHPRRYPLDRKDAIKEELTKLFAAGFIKEVLDPDWLANPVLVRKKTGQWRMCVDYIDLNKSCPKDPFGLPRIDQVVDSTAGCELLSVLDCYSGYHQIRLKESDCLKTSFITHFRAYCYITMPFELKNEGATYQRMIQRCFSTQIGRNVEAYVDDVVVKTKQKDDLITDLEETFASIRAFRMKLNPEKCIFGVPSGKLLGFMVSHRGIQANPEKINVILNMKLPSSQ